MSVRRARLPDAPAIALVLRTAFAEYESLYTAAAFAATTPASEEIEQRICEGPVWVALLDDVVIGTVSAVPRGETLHIRGMAVIPSARGLQVGRMLLEQVEWYARACDFSQLELSTTPFLSSAVALYERSGFRRDDTGPHDLLGTPLFTMRKILEERYPVEGSRERAT